MGVSPWKFIPYQFFYLSFGRYWEIATISSAIFAAIHWYFGKWFIIYAFLMGLVYFDFTKTVDCQSTDEVKENQTSDTNLLRHKLLDKLLQL